MIRFDASADDLEILGFLHDVADAAADTVDETTEWTFTGERDGQYTGDVAVDEVVVDMCEAAGFFVLSEESGAGDLEWPLRDGRLLMIVDPIDGSTNASKGLPWFATSLCVLDEHGPRVSLVAEQSGSEIRYHAIRGHGAKVDGMRMQSRPNHDPSTAVVGVNALPASDHGWWQVRSMGAASLDICAVARGGLDGYVDFDGLHVWDYAGALLVCQEVGMLVAEADGGELWTVDPTAVRRPLVANSPQMLASLRAASRQ